MICEMRMKTAIGETGLEQADQDGIDMMWKGEEDLSENGNTSTTTTPKEETELLFRKKRVIIVRTTPQL